MSATQFQAMLRAGGVSGTGERELKSISVLTLAKASVQPEEASTCCLRATAKSIMAVLNLPTKEKRRQSLLSGPRRTSMTKSQSTYSGI